MGQGAKDEAGREQLKRIPLDNELGGLGVGSGAMMTPIITPT